MKKIGILLLIIICISGCVKKENNIYEDISYYKKENLTRYNSYKKNHLSLSNEEIVTYVNLGLDKAFYTNTRESKQLNKITILVNKYIYVPRDYKPDNLVIMEKYSKPNIYLVKEAYDAFIEMAEDIKKENLNIRAISAYRDVAYQENLYLNYNKNDSVEVVDTYSARPKFSVHHTGLCVDLDNGNLLFMKGSTYNSFGPRGNVNIFDFIAMKRLLLNS